MFIIGLVIVLCALVFLVSALIKLCTEKPRVRNDRVKLLNKGAAQSSNSAGGESKNDSQKERSSIKDGTENNDTNGNSTVPGATEQAKNRSKASESSRPDFSTHPNGYSSQDQVHPNSQNDNINNLGGNTFISNFLLNQGVNYAQDGNMVPEHHLYPYPYPYPNHYHQQHHQVYPLYDNMGSQRYRMTMPPTNHANAGSSSSSTTIKSPFTNDYGINLSSGGTRKHNSGQKASAVNTRPKSYRLFTKDQREVLENFFRKNDYPNPQDKLNLSTQLSVDQSRIDTWFHHRRAKDNRMKKDKSDNNDNMRIKRKVFGKDQREVLENFFQNNKYPDKDDKKNLSSQLNDDQDRIHKWFDNRRAKDKRMKKDKPDKNLESSKNIPYELEKEVSGVDHYSRSSRAPRLYPISSMQSGLQCDGRNSGGVTMGSFVSENYVPPGGFTGQNMNVREVSDQHVPHNTGGNLVAQPGFDYGLRNDSEPAQQKYSSQDDDPDFCSELKMPTPIPYKTSLNLPTATPNEKPRLFEMLPYDEDYYHHYGLSNHGLIDYRDSDDYRYYDYYDYAPMEDRDCPSI